MSVIVVKIKGGLGNTMFQYAVGKSLSVKLGSNLILDLKNFNKNSLWKFQLNKFPIYKDINFNEKTNYIFKFIFPYFKPNNSLLIKLRKLFKKSVFIENNLRFDSSIFNLSPDIYLDGYFQSENYFNNISEVIRKDFYIPDLVFSEYEKTIASFANNYNSVGLHVRRGDYVNTKVHGLMTAEYFKSALKYLESKFGKNLYIGVFSDDILWVKNNIYFSNSYKVLFVEQRGVNRDFIDLSLLSRFKNQIISNSSFSWWAAWLNNNSNKIVIAPEKWFADEKLQNETKDIVPSNWIKF